MDVLSSIPVVLSNEILSPDVLITFFLIIAGGVFTGMLLGLFAKITWWVW